MACIKHRRYENTCDTSSTIAAHLTQEEKELSGVYDDMIRISVGIEDIEDLKEDFRRVIKGEDENGES